MTIQGTTNFSQLFTAPEVNTPKIIQKKMGQFEIKSNLTVSDWVVINETSIAVLFHNRRDKPMGYMKAEVAKPEPEYLYKVNTETGDAELLASGHEYLSLFLSEGELMCHRKMDQNNFYKIDESEKKFTKTDDLPKEIDLRKFEQDGKSICSWCEWNNGRLIVFREIKNGKSKYEVALFKKDCFKPIKQFTYEGGPFTTVLAAVSDKAIFFGRERNRLVYFDLENEEVINTIEMGEMKSVEGKYIDDENILILEKQREYPCPIFLNRFSICEGKMVWKEKLKIFAHTAYWSHVNWDLTEKVHRVSTRLGLTQMSPSDHYSLLVCDLNKQDVEKKAIDVQVKPVPQFSGDVMGKIPPEVHKALATKAKEEGVTLLEFLGMKLQEIAKWSLSK